MSDHLFLARVLTMNTPLLSTRKGKNMKFLLEKLMVSVHPTSMMNIWQLWDETLKLSPQKVENDVKD